MHHSRDSAGLEAEQEQLRQLLEKEAERQELGATGLFPQGKLEPGDEGEIRFAVTNVKGKVVIKFGKPVAYLGMDAEQALALSKLLKQHAREAAGKEKPSVPPKPGSYR